MLKPQWQLGDDRFGVRDGVDRDVIALKGFDEGFGHSVGLRAADRCRARLHPNIQQQRFRVCRNKARSIVGQPLDGLRKDIDAAETVFDGRYDKVLNIFALDAFSGGDMGNGLAVTAVERKGNADLFFVIAADFETVRAPTQIRLSTVWSVF